MLKMVGTLGTMREYINAMDIEMVSVNDKEWSVVRDNNGVLWRVNFTGILWQEAVLDRGPVGQDFELAVDGDNVTHVVYFREDLNEVRLVRVDGQETTKTVLSRGSTLSSVIGMSLDGDNLEQVATVNQLNNSFTIELLRSLVGQDTGRISPNPSSVYISEMISKSQIYSPQILIQMVLQKSLSQDHLQIPKLILQQGQFTLPPPMQAESRTKCKLFTVIQIILT